LSAANTFFKGLRWVMVGAFFRLFIQLPAPLSGGQIVVVSLFFSGSFLPQRPFVFFDFFYFFFFVHFLKQLGVICGSTYWSRRRDLFVFFFFSPQKNFSTEPVFRPPPFLLRFAIQSSPLFFPSAWSSLALPCVFVFSLVRPDGVHLMVITRNPVLCPGCVLAPALFCPCFARRFVPLSL